MKNLTLKDIAKALNISITTVSKALKDYPDVSPKTKARVKAYAEKVNFTPNTFASYLRTQESKIIGVIIPQLNHFFFNDVLKGIIKQAEAHDYMVIVLSSEESYQLEQKQVMRLLQQNVDGILISISDTTHDISHLKQVEEQNVNLIMFDKYSKLINCPAVVINDRKAAYDAVKHLIDGGKRKIAHFRGPLLPQNSIDRFLGYRQALEDHGIAYNKELVFTCEHIDEKEGYAFAREILEKNIDVDAVFSVADLPAVGALKCFNENNIEVPNQIAVMGFSNWLISKFTSPALSTVNQPGTLMGEEAFSLFLKSNEAKKRGEKVAGDILELDTQLIVRKSS